MQFIPPASTGPGEESDWGLAVGGSSTGGDGGCGAGGSWGGRRKELKRIETARDRQVALKKRRSGLARQAGELSVHCGAEVALIVVSDDGCIFEFATTSVESTIERYKKARSCAENVGTIKIEPDIQYQDDDDDDDDDGEEPEDPQGQLQALLNSNRVRSKEVRNTGNAGNWTGAAELEFQKRLQEESAKLQNQIQIAESINWNLMGGDLSNLEDKRLKSLEAQIEKSLNKVRAKKDGMILKNIAQLERKEMQLRQEELYLRNMITEREQMLSGSRMACFPEMVVKNNPLQLLMSPPPDGSSQPFF